MSFNSRGLRNAVITATITFMLSLTFNALAADKIPRNDFIKYTNDCLDVMDQLEVTFSKYEVSKYEVNKLMDKHSLCMKKYERYIMLRELQNNTLQEKIINKLSVVGILVPFEMIKFEVDKGSIKSIRQSLKEINDDVKANFVKYNNIE